MKREDAIKTLKELWRETNDPWYEEVYNMAINALEADRKTEPTISKMEQVDKDINVRSKDEPQTCSVSGRPYSECADCEHFRCTADEPQRDCKECKYAWWNGERYECPFEECRYSQTERSE